MADVTLDIENPQAVLNDPQAANMTQGLVPAVADAVQNGVPVDVIVEQEPQIQEQTQTTQPVTPQFSPEDEQAFMQQLQNGTSKASEMQQVQPKADPLGAFGKGLDVLDDITRKGVGGGVLDAVVNAGEFVTSTGKFVYDIFDKGWSKAQYKEQNWNTVREAIMPDEPELMVSHIAKGISQWATGFLTTGNLGVGMKIGTAVSKTGRYAQILGHGAATDVLFFDRQQDRVSDWINNNFPSLANPVTRFLSAKGKDENMAESMLKMALEGAGLGAATDAGLVLGLKLLKLGRAYFAKPTAENAKAYEKVAEELETLNKSNTKTVDESQVEILGPEKEVKEGAKDAGDAATNGKSTANAVDNPDNLPATGGKREGETGHAADDADTTTKVEGTSKQTVTSNLKEEQFKSATELELEIRDRIKNGEPLTGKREGINLTTHMFSNPEGATVLGHIADVQAENLMKNVKGPEAHQKILDDTMKELKQYGFTWNSTMAEGKQAIKNVQDAARTAVKVQEILHTMTNAARELSQKMVNGLSTLQDQCMLAAIYRNMQEFTVLHGDLATASGRILSAHKIKITDEMSNELIGKGLFGDNWFTPENLTKDGMRKFLTDFGVDENTLMNIARGLVHEGDDIVKATKLLQKAKPTWSWAEVAQEIRINGLLSGPTTALVNFGGSGAYVAVIKPMERLIGSALSGNAEGFRSAFNYIKGMNYGFREAWQMARKVWQTGENILDYGSGLNRLEHNNTHAMTYDKFKEWLLRGKPEGTELSEQMEMFARGVGWLGDKIRLPGYAIQTQDEFCKQLAFRGQLFADIAEEARVNGVKGKENLKGYFDKRMSDALTPEGHVIEGPLTDKALKWAREATFQTPLSGKVDGKIQAVINSHFLAKLMIPFYRSPMNLFYDACRHVNAYPTQALKDAINAGGESKADALGRLAVGYSLVGSSVMLAAEGRITGAYPKNDKEAALWRSAGIQPYSIRIGDSWVEYRRFDPFAMIMSVAADAYTKVHYDNADITGEAEISDKVKALLHGVAIAVSNNLMDKTYMQGLSDGMKTMDDMERYGPRYLGQQIASFMPYSSAYRFTKNTFIDPNQRELENTWDYVQNALPGGSFGLPTKHDWITGQPVTYKGAILRNVEHDEVKEELLRLGTAVMGAPSKEMNGIKLNAEQYARYCELHGSIKIDGKTMEEALSALMKSPLYDMERKRFKDGLEGQDTPRTIMVNKLINRYREVAQHQMYVEFDDLKGQKIDNIMTRNMSKGGALTVPDSHRGKYANLIDNLKNSVNF